VGRRKKYHKTSRAVSETNGSKGEGITVEHGSLAVSIPALSSLMRSFPPLIISSSMPVLPFSSSWKYSFHLFVYTLDFMVWFITCPSNKCWGSIPKQAMTTSVSLKINTS
jgi:hypothetical protein